MVAFYNKIYKVGTLFLKFVVFMVELNCFRCLQITLHLPLMTHVLTTWCSMLWNAHLVLYSPGLNHWRLTILVTCPSATQPFVLLSILLSVCTMYCTLQQTAVVTELTVLLLFKLQVSNYTC